MIFLDKIMVQQKVCILKGSMVLPHRQEGQFHEWKSSFRLMMNRSLGGQWDGMLRLMSMMGYEIEAMRISLRMAWRPVRAMEYKAVLRSVLAAMQIGSRMLLRESHLRE